MLSVHRSKTTAARGICGALGLAASACALAASGSCSAETVVVNQAVRLYVPASCGDAGGAPVTYTGLGDFQPMSPPTETVALGSDGFALTALPSATREIVVAPVSDAGWAGAALVPDAGSVAMLVLPVDTACSLSGGTGLGDVPGTSAGMLDATHVLLVGGNIPPFVVDLGTGLVKQLSSGLNPSRVFATVTPYGAGALIAGGEDPAEGTAQATAVVYTPGAGGIDGTYATLLLPNGQQRKQHAAVSLPDGRTLLIGGVTDTGTLVTAVDALDPSQPIGAQASPTGAGLQYGRIQPTAIVLPTGQVFVGGGVDAAGRPIAEVEWLTVDPATHAVTSDPTTASVCNAGVSQAFAPTEGGAVLAVMGVPSTNGCKNVSLILPTGVVEQAFDLAPSPTRVFAIQGPQASPLILTGASVLRWNPWSKVLEPLGTSAVGPSSPLPAVIAAAPGLALWLAEDSFLQVLRFDTRGPFATDFEPPSYLDTDDRYTSPDRLPGTDVNFSVGTGATLANGASIFVTDATYEAVTVGVALPTGGGVDVVLRDPGGVEIVCAARSELPESSVTVVRSGSSASATSGSGATVPCTGTVDAAARVSVGVRAAPSGTSVVRALTVTRSST